MVWPAWVVFPLAAVCEIVGCFAVWKWWRESASAVWLAPGAAALAAFAFLLARAPVDAAGRAYAAYGGVYVAASLLWLVVVEARRPSLADLAGAGLCLLGCAVVVFGPRD